MIKGIYTKLVPAGLRLRLYKLRKAIVRLTREIEWKLGGSAVLRRVDKKLDPGPHFWLFLLGSNNSGTTLLMRILSRHPLIRSMPKEGQQMTQALPYPPAMGVRGLFTTQMDRFRWTESDDASMVPRVRYDWARAYSGHPPGILLEKSPPSTLRARWLQKHFSPARFIVLTRNPYAVCEGNRRRRGYSIEAAAHHWKLIHETLKEDIPHLERVLVLTYEELCSAPRETLERIREFIDVEVPFDESVVEGKYAVHSSEGRESKPITDFNAKSLARLSKEDLATVTQIVSPIMTEFGYEVSR